jgi:hypothetical protein
MTFHARMINTPRKPIIVISFVMINPVLVLVAIVTDKIFFIMYVSVNNAVLT